VRDVVFLAVVIAFFALATVFVAACEFLIGRRSLLEERRS
jgi:hypothetical protein